MAGVYFGAWARLLCLSTLDFQLTVLHVHCPFCWWTWLTWEVMHGAGAELSISSGVGYVAYKANSVPLGMSHFR